MKTLLLAASLALAVSSPALAQFNGNGNGNGNRGVFNGNFNGNGGGRGAGVGIGVGIASAASVSSASAQGGLGGTASNSTTFKDQRQAPGLGLAGLAMGGLSCRGSASIGLSLPGGAGGIGFPVPDDECERRQWAGMLAAAKDPRARALAWAIMQRSPIIQQAMQDTGIGVAEPGASGAALPPRGGSARVTAYASCHRWSGGAIGVGSCLF
jgi:hypothetical protein